MKQPITQAQYAAFQTAYDFFNEKLFGGSLPHVLVTLQRHAKARGYFAAERPAKLSGFIASSCADVVLMLAEDADEQAEDA